VSTSEESFQRIESLVRALESGGDVETRRRAQDLVRLLLDVHRDGLGRVLGALRGLPGGEPACAALERDPLVAHLLLLHGLHPRPPAARIEDALAALCAEGHAATLRSVDDGVAHVQVVGLLPGARLRVEESVWAAAPDLEGVVVLDAKAARRLPVATETA
jgi:hypothetical protein